MTELALQVVGQGGVLGWSPDLKEPAKKLNLHYVKKINPRLEQMRDACKKCGVRDIYVYQGHAGRLESAGPGVAAYTGVQYDGKSEVPHYTEVLTTWKADIYTFELMLRDFQQKNGLPSVIVVVGCESGSDWQPKFAKAGAKVVVSSGGASDPGVAAGSIETLVNRLAEGKTVDQAIRAANEVIEQHNSRVTEPMSPLQAWFGKGASGRSTIVEILQ